MDNLNEKVQSTNKISAKTITMVALMAAVCSILGPLVIPIGAVPISLTVVSVYLCVYVLGWKKGTLAYVVYLLLGCVGLPVFSGYEGGPQKLAGPTGGYLIGMILMAIVTGLFIDKFNYSKFYMHIVGMVLGLTIAYAFGTVWFMLLMHMGVMESLAVCVFPFLIFDAIKIAACTVVGLTLRKALSRAGVNSYY